MSQKKGTISVNTKDILPIIKKWLYSEHDIFLRELISNSCDAITKRIVLGRTKNVEVPEAEIEVEIDRMEKKIIVHDNGIGMTEEEIEKYIAKLAFSGAEEFVTKMKELGADSKNDIIGKFGLGFYSVFMVADKVEVDSLSVDEGAKAVKWICEGDVDYSFEESKRTTAGTSITLHINSEAAEFLDGYKSRSTIKKYCNFMPFPIYIKDHEEERMARKEKDKDKEKDKKDEASSDEEIVRQALNKVDPLWKKDPTTLKDDDYLSFYRDEFPMDPDPLFWIHLKIDHPFELIGILYFPKLNPNKPTNEQNIKLFAKQVFVSDNVKNIIPDFLSLLKGFIDSPDIPLNVSRSSLQGDPNIKKISNYIVKKVADSLKKLCKNERERYEKIWEDIGLFVKYGCISDEKFDETMREFVFFKNYSNKLMTLEEYEKSIPETYKDKLKEKIIYAEKGKGDVFLRKQLLDEGIESVETDTLIDPHFMQHTEFKKLNGKLYKFAAVNSEVENLLAQENSTDTHMKIKDLFKSILAKVTNTDQTTTDKENDGKDSAMEVEIKAYKNSDAPAYFKSDEYMRRLQYMTRTMGSFGHSDMPVKKTLVINPSNTLVQNALKLWEKDQEANKELVSQICHHIEDLAHISSEGLQNNEEKDAFVTRSQKLLQNLTNYIV
ncbi:MAG: molecular chaperone HtpG [Oligoflexia bacterium]|nr:molecular chaperone HtpG [Oligoflexia bacterium]